MYRSGFMPVIEPERNGFKPDAQRRQGEYRWCILINEQ